MNVMPAETRQVFDALSQMTGEAWAWQGAIALVAGLCAYLVRSHVKRLIAESASLDLARVRQWPLGLAIFALLAWIGYALLAQTGQSVAALRIAALAITAIAGASLTLRAVGQTALGWTAVFIIFAAALLEALGVAAIVVEALDSVGLPLGVVHLTPWFALKSVLIVGGLFWGAQHIGDLIDRGLTHEQVFSRSGQVLFAKLTRALLFALALVFSLGALGVDITTLAVLSGAIGLGLGFGFQKVVSNYVSGLILLMDKSVKPGDVIEVEFGGGRLRGEVTELAGRFTAITLRTGVETLIPNEVLISSPVSNWSHTSRNVQIRIPVGVSYNTDLEKAIALCAEAAAAAPRVLENPAPVCLVVGFGDSSVDLDVRFWISDPELGVRNVSSAVFLEIWKRFHEHGIEIPFPQRDLHLRTLPEGFPTRAG